MPTVTFEDYNTNVVETTIDDLRMEILSLDRWFSGLRNSGRLDYSEQLGSTLREESLTLVAHPQMGYYLNYGIMTEDEHVSVGDRGRLEEKAVMPDGSWLAAGHFVSPELAWVAVKEFCRTGNRSDKLDWIPVEELPDIDWWYEGK